MTAKEPLLSICIPTYNREKYLKELLDSIVRQNEFLETDDIEIVVDDGPSTDNTELMVKDYIKKYGNKIKYYRNHVRIGMCPAFLEALDLGRGRYCRIFSSDDSMVNRTLEITLKIIRQEDPSLIFGREKTRGLSMGEVGDLIKVFNGMGDFLVYLGEKGREKEKRDIFAFISSFCVKKTFFEKNLKYILSEGFKIEDIKNNYFNFSLVGFSQVFSSDKIVVVENPIFIQYTPENASRKPNIKIKNDMNTLCRFIMNKYCLSKNSRKFFVKLRLYRYSVCAIVPIVCRLIPYPSEKIYKGLQNFYHKILKKLI